MRPSTHFVTNIECQDAKGKEIADAVLAEFDKRGVQPKKIMSLGSDGASVMTGKEKGLFLSLIMMSVGLTLLCVGLTGFWLCESLNSLLPFSRWITVT